MYPIVVDKNIYIANKEQIVVLDRIDVSLISNFLFAGHRVKLVINPFLNKERVLAEIKELEIIWMKSVMVLIEKQRYFVTKL